MVDMGSHCQRRTGIGTAFPQSWMDTIQVMESRIGMGGPGHILPAIANMDTMFPYIVTTGYASAAKPPVSYDLKEEFEHRRTDERYNGIQMISIWVRR